MTTSSQNNTPSAAMEPSEEPNPAVSPAPMAAPDLFDFPRPTKKRNYIRRGDKSELEAANPIIAPAATQATKVTESTVVDLQNMIITSTTRKTTSDEDDEIGVPGGLAQILRRGKKQGRAKKGLDIAEVVPKVSRDIEDTTLQPEEGDSKGATEQELAAVVNRFTHQTGQVLNVDKHMMTYIEQEMEKLRRAQIGEHAGSSSQQDNVDPNSVDNKTAFWQPTRPADRGATLGKLHEVDLGEENKMRNITRTQEATRRLEDGEPMELDGQLDGKAGKRPYRRRRRNSQDIQRDKLVEEVLKESKLELYDEPQEGEEEEDEGAADDRIAEKFRREFLDALMSRRRRRGNYQKNKKRDDTKKPRGPKLGGSRSARAAMRESQMAANNGVKK